MKRQLAWWGVALVLAGTLFSAFQRIRNEADHRRTAILADWQELNLAAARDPQTPAALLQALHDHGVQGIVVQPLTLDQLWQDKRVTSLPEAPGRDPLDTSALRVSDPALASLLYWEWTHRGVAHLERPQKIPHSKDMLLKRDGATFLGLKDVESAYDLELLTAAQRQGMGIVFRISQDPWLSTGDVAAYVNDHPLLPYARAIVWNTESPLGGWDGFAAWKTWMEHRGVQTLLFEFKPPKSQRRMARALPGLTQRAHTINVNELREMRPNAELARWRRAAMERSCRFLLVHISPEQSLSDYLDHTAAIGTVLQKAGLELQWPLPHPLWRPTPAWYRTILQLEAFAVAAFGPLLGLYWMPKRAAPLQQFLAISGITLACALTAAALANWPETRLQTVPFRGIKLAFVIGWLGSGFLLFRPGEIAQFLLKSVRRLDVLIGLFAAGALAYVLLRTGNAGNEWTSPWEQPLRDTLESWFVMRPRFKEFAFGHPLLLAGLMAMKRRSPLLDPRLLLFLGMIGQASMTNTFAHLHTPLILGLARSIMGLGLGVIVGWVLNRILLEADKKVNV